MTEELWMQILGWEQSYSVSSLGRVKSHARIVVEAGGRRHPVLEKVLRPSEGTNRYFKVGLSRNSIMKSASVRVLVAQAFLGPRPDGLQVCHNDGKKWNNVKTNLRYGTHLENDADQDAHQTRRRGEAHGSSKVNEGKVQKIRCDVRTHRLIADEFGISPASVSNIKSRKTWGHV